MLEALKDEVCDQNHELPRNGLVVGSGGNVSGRDPETGLVVIKPSGVNFSKLTLETMVVVDMDGTVIEGDMKPSVDTGLHLYIYKHRADVLGITHTHSPYTKCNAMVHPREQSLYVEFMRTSCIRATDEYRV